LIEPEGRILRVEIDAPELKGSPAPNAPLALWIGGGRREMDVYLPTMFSHF
jgi:hypothetical protein